MSRFLGRFLLCTAVAVLGSWTCAAFWFRLDAPLRWPALALTSVVGVAIIFLGQRRPAIAWSSLGLAAMVAAVWWISIRPSDNRDWAPDVARGVTGDVHGTDVRLYNIRDFEWRTEQDFTPRWETRRYALDRLESVDLISSVWGNPAIAHTLISFGLSDGDHVVFSAEIRRERDESFSEIGGFFKDFELVMIAATENDIVRLRTDVRRENVSLFPLRLSTEQARALFISYVEKANELASKPEFYQTITTNCTTVIFELARLIEPGMPLDWRILLSGFLPDYLYDHGLLRTDLPLEEVKRKAAIVPRAQGLTSAADFSIAIRKGLE